MSKTYTIHMKLHEIVDLPANDRLDEMDLKKAISTGAFALSTLMAPNQAHTPAPEPVSSTTRQQMDTAVLANTILKKYRVSPELAQKVATLAKKYEKDSFPKAADILAIVGIESSFNPRSVSNLKDDPAVGLTQVRPGVWGINPASLQNSVEMQVKSGADILHKYFKRYGDISTAVHVYNIGPGNFRKGKHNPEYVHRFKNERKLYQS